MTKKVSPAARHFGKIRIDSRTSGIDRVAASVTALAVFTLLLGSTSFAVHSFIQKGQTNARSLILLEVAGIRAKLESELNSRISLERGLVSFITLNRGMNDYEFSAFARSLINGDSVIKNISVLKGTVISYVYPRQGNESALGRDLAQVPGQRDDVLFVRDTGATIVAGPIDLVQGGRAVVSRMPVFLYDQSGGKRYWGQASVVIAFDKLFAAAGIGPSTGIRIALRNAAKKEDVFEGDPGIFLSDPILMEVNFPGGAWTIAGVPAKGWRDAGPDYLVSFLALAFVAGVMAFIAGAFVSARARMKTMAYHDPLTGLPNRVLFWDRLGVSLAFARRQGTKVALCMVDLVRFKDINDSLGHAVGDELLAEVARRLSSCMRESDTVARLGGDEFAVITVFEITQGWTDTVTSRILAEFESDFVCAGKALRIEASIGIAVWPDDGDDPEKVLSIADARMYEMKRGSTAGGLR